ncbi:MAG TPA: nitronate monooxygenase [Caulobacteraceae bacterium]|jgi:nitronate monooxygenase|nr:nitronate monooxygenase [Caulobacteraceae bacterium]
MAGPLDALELDTPIIQAPMGGGFTTPELIAAVCDAGGLGSLGLTYSAPEAIAAAAEEMRRLTNRAFAINLFVFETPPIPPDSVKRTAERLAPYCRELGIEPPDFSGPAHPSIPDQIEAVMAARPAVFSFTLGMPEPKVLAEFKRLGIVTVGTATTLAEGLALEAAGVQAVCAQGAEAGGHRGTFIGPWQDGMVGTLPLTRMLAARLSVPVIAAGGIMDGATAAGMLRVGAAAVQMGTAFLACPESGVPAAHTRALLGADAAHTAVTSAFSGKPARGIVGRYMREMEAEAPELAPFPVLNLMTRGLRAAAAKQDRGEFMSLWAGQAAPLSRAMPVAELMATLKAEMA